MRLLSLNADGGKLSMTTDTVDQNPETRFFAFFFFSFSLAPWPPTDSREPNAPGTTCDAAAPNGA